MSERITQLSSPKSTLSIKNYWAKKIHVDFKEANYNHADKEEDISWNEQWSKEEEQVFPHLL